VKIVIDIGDSQMGPDNQREVIRRMTRDGLELVGANGWHVGCLAAGVLREGCVFGPYDIVPLAREY
jgi:hypothetical protein